MPYSRNELSPSVAPPFKKVQPGDLYLGTWDYPEQYFPVQDYVFGLGSDPNHIDTNLVPALQGVEYLLSLATGITPLTIENVIKSMSYTDKREFRNGALREFPKFWIIIRDALLQLPKGREVLDIVHSIKEYTDLP